MENSSSEIIFAQKFPDARPAALLKKAEELSHTIPVDHPPLPPSLGDMLKQCEENYVYVPSLNAKKKSKAFIDIAKLVCTEFEIDTTITKREHAIDVTMDLFYGWHSRDIKHAFVAVLRLADDFTLSHNPNEPDYVRVSMTYYTHIPRKLIGK